MTASKDVQARVLPKTALHNTVSCFRLSARPRRVFLDFLSPLFPSALAVLKESEPVRITYRPHVITRISLVLDDLPLGLRRVLHCAFDFHANSWDASWKTSWDSVCPALTGLSVRSVRQTGAPRRMYQPASYARHVRCASRRSVGIFDAPRGSHLQMTLAVHLSSLSAPVCVHIRFL